ncbi:MAG: cytochrome c biogenesis protein CcdA [Candidatus Zixiibacteriota bacterium]
MRILIALAFSFLSCGGTALADVAQFGLGGAEEDLVSVSTVFSQTAALPGGTYSGAVVVDIVPGWHINSSRPHQEYLIPAAVTFDTITGLTPTDLRYPAGSDEKLADEVMSVYSDRVVIPFDIRVAADLAHGEHTLPVRFTYQPCNDRECRAPQTVDVPITILVGPSGGPANTAVFAQAESTESTSPPQNPAGESELERLIREYGSWGYFLVLGVAFVTGLLLSFSPCTYPMIPITVSIFAGQERTVGRGFFLSLVYVGTMAVVYGIMGLIVSLLGGVFGAWLASPPVVIGIVIVFVVFALSMFGQYDLNVPSALRQKLGTGRAGGGVAGSIVLGVIAALVVSPCVGPFVAGILLYIATTGSPVIGFLTLFFFALGLGTLFVLIGTFSSAINRLPRSGEWMETVKKFFGFVLLLMAVFFLQTLISPALTALITALLLLAFGVFGGGVDRLTSEAGFFLRLKKFLGLTALLVGAYLLLALLFTEGFILPSLSGSFSRSEQGTIIETTGITGWVDNLETGLSRAKAEGRPVIIDTWATWCANCKVLEKKTFRDADVGREAARFVPIKVQLEKENSPETLAFKARFGLKTYSLPTTLLLGSDGQVSRILVGVIGPDDFISELRQVR